MSIVTIREILDGLYEDKLVSFKGWIYRKRASKKTIFLIVRDASGVIQCTVKQNADSWHQAENATIESSISVEGIAKHDERAPGNYEISVEKLSIIGLAETFPITSGEESEQFLRDVRHLWIRSRKMNLIMKVRSEVLKFCHDFFREAGFYEVSPPMFISSACEGGATLFGLKYFGNDLYLTQSAQLYLEALIYSLEKVYCVAPSFRAEKSRTIRHLSEYWHVEPEWAFAKMDDLMKLEEDLVSYICKKTVDNCQRELTSLKVDTSKLTAVNPPLPRITYTEAVEMLEAKDSKIKWGEDFGFEDEKILADNFEGPVFVYAYPTKIKAFYCKTYKDNPDLAMSVDMLVPRIGELSTGGAREDSKAELLKRLKHFGLSVKDYDWYIDLRRYGTVPHVGFGLGVERLLTWMLELENIVDSIPFPRTIRRFYP
ncbi:MAG: asparagine--tRNA ligase [Candidatus Bathyarchaeota archaeon]